MEDIAEVVRHIGDDHAPWADTGFGLDIKVLRFNVTTGVWVLRNRFRPGARLQRHRHTGPVNGFTLEGRWHYLEYDFFSTAGSFIYEPANSTHTLDVPADNKTDTDVLFVIEGALLNLDEDGNVTSVVDGHAILDVYFGLLEAQGIARPNGILS